MHHKLGQMSPMQARRDVIAWDFWRHAGPGVQVEGAMLVSEWPTVYCLIAITMFHFLDEKKVYYRDRKFR